MPRAIKQTLYLAMRDPDRWVVEIEYEDAKGQVTHRTISPTAFVGETHLRALCLGREEPRQFRIAGIRSAELRPAHTVLMPEPIT